VKIGEAATGIGEEMADTGLAIQRAQDKTEQMQARAAAVDELVESGTLEDYTSSGTQLDRELAQISAQSQVDADLERLKGELAGGKQKELEKEIEVIVRVMGEGQFRLGEEAVDRLNELDERAQEALDRDDEGELDRYLDEMAAARQRDGERLRRTTFRRPTRSCPRVT
jgi:phage shock protein A